MQCATLSMSAVSGVPDFDELLHKSRDEHVSIFFETQQAAKSVKEVGSKIAALHTSLDRHALSVRPMISAAQVTLLLHLWGIH